MTITVANSLGLPSAALAQNESTAGALPSNKPPETGESKINQAHLFIDKLSCTHDVPWTDHQKHIAGFMMDLPKELGSGWMPGSQKGYKVAARFHPAQDNASNGQSPTSTNFVLFQAGPTKGQGGYLRMEWNPARFTTAQHNQIFKVLDDLFDLPPPTVAGSKVTRADIAVEFPGIWIGDYCFTRRKAPKRMLVYHAGKLETLYLGTKAKGQFCIYDKAAHLGACTMSLTRVEYRAKPGKRADELHTLKNPLASILVIDLAKLDLGVGEPQMKAMRAALRAEGIDSVLNSYPPEVRADWRKTILKARASFWNPEEIWQGWPDAIAAAFPPFGSPDHYGNMDKPTLSVQSIAQQ